jgi:hypothetical protein
VNAFQDGAASSRDVRKIGREMAWFIDELPQQDNIYIREQYQVCNSVEDVVPLFERSPPAARTTTA